MKEIINYLVRDIPRDLWGKLKMKATIENLTVREALIKAMEEWTNDKSK